MKLISLVLFAVSAALINLPEPRKDSSFSLEKAINERRSVRSYADAPLNLQEVSQLLWAAQGIVASGRRAAPSAGAKYPMEIYVIIGNVEGLKPGLYLYRCSQHALKLIREGDWRVQLSAKALRQDMILKAPITILVSAVVARTREKYGERAERYVYIEAGHIAQNIALQATALSLGTVTVGAFIDEEVQRILQIKETPVYLLPVGRK